MRNVRDMIKLLVPFERFTLEVSKSKPSIHMSARMYLQLEQLLKKIVRKEGEWAHIDQQTVKAVQAGLDKFNKYNEYMKENMIYFVALILDPRIKTCWIKKNMEDPDTLIEEIRTFLKATYPQ
jgi:hypothetical protein